MGVTKPFFVKTQPFPQNFTNNSYTEFNKNHTTSLVGDATSQTDGQANGEIDVVPK
jgi:hypothetical protein